MTHPDSGGLAASIPRPSLKKRLSWSIGLPIGLAAVLLYLAIRGADWQLMLDNVRQADPLLLGVAGIAMTGSLLTRGFRWRILLAARQPVRWPTVFLATCAGYLGNYFLPARAGELLRTYLIGVKTGISKSFVLATALTERLLDAVFLILMLALAVGQLGVLPDWLSTAVQTMGLLGIVGSAGLFVVPHLSPLVVRMTGWLPMSGAWKDKLLGIVLQFLEGMYALQHVRRSLLFSLLTVTAWSIDVVFAWGIGQAFGMDLSFWHIVLLLVALGLSSAAPSTPGYVGIYQFVAVTVLGPMGFTQNQALVYIIAYQALSYLVVTLWGLPGLWLLRQRATPSTT